LNAAQGHWGWHISIAQPSFRDNICLAQSQWLWYWTVFHLDYDTLHKKLSCRRKAAQLSL